MPRPGETKLTPDQRAELLALYAGGQTAKALAARFGVSDTLIRQLLREAGTLRTRAAAQTLRSRQQQDAITPETQEKIIALYSAGMGLQRIAEFLGWTRGAFGRVRRVLEDAGLDLRTQRAAALAGWTSDPDIDRITPARWHELYNAPGSGYPSVAELARRFQVKPHTIARYLRSADVPRRSPSEQERIDIRLGRRSIPDNPNRAANFGGSRMPRGYTHTPKARAGIAAARRARARESYTHAYCPWCGTRNEWRLCDLKERAAPTCNRSCAARYTGWKRRHGEGAIRPGIAAALSRAIGRTQRTYDRAAALAPDLGATEAEILAALDLDPGHD